MLNFYAPVFLKLCNGLHIYEALADKRVEQGKTGYFTLNLPDEEKIKYAGVPTLLRDAGLTTSQAFAETLSKYITGEVETNAYELKSTCEHLRWTIITELEKRTVLMIPPHQVHYYNSEQTFLGEKILKKFRVLRKDALEAGNCFALGRYTACVFHLMRVMEYVVQKLGKKFQIKDLHKKAWGKVLNEVKGEIGKLPYGAPNERKKKDRYQNCYALLDAVCNARNATMHSKLSEMESTVYTEEDAQNCMDRVKNFIKDFITLPKPT